ncbi:MAG: DUF4112 domain-containing protein [Vicinamibacterales bacterium]
MLDSLLLWLTVAFVAAVVLAVGGFYLARWLFVRSAERVAATIDRAVGSAAARSLTRLGAYARATGIDFPEADRRFGLYIERLARLMDSAVTLPLIGPVGLDAALTLIPGIGDLIGGGLLLIVARSPHGPPAALISKMLANVVTDVILGAIPVVGVPADIWFRANDRNALLMREYLSRPS